MQTLIPLVLIEVNKKYEPANDKEKDEFKNCLESNEYEIKTYKDLYNFFKDKKPQKVKYYKEFLYALEKHSHDTDDTREIEMFRRFYQKIDKLNQNHKNKRS